MVRKLIDLLLIALLFGFLPQPKPAQAEPAVPQSTPQAWTDGRTANGAWTLATDRVLFVSLGGCTASTHLFRIPLTSNTARPILTRGVTGNCQPYNIRSNIVADGDFLYWMDDTGLVRLSLTEPSEGPVMMNPNFRNSAESHSIAIIGDQVYGGSGLLLWHSSKTWLDGGEVAATLSAPISSLSSDGAFVYFLSGQNLYAHTPSRTPSIIARNVRRYYANGLVRPLGSFPAHRLVYYAQYANPGTPATLRRIDLLGGNDDLIYTSSAPVGLNTQIEAITSDKAALNSRLFFWEQQSDNCGAFVDCDAALTLYRSQLNGMGRVAIATHSGKVSVGLDELRYAQNALFYRWGNLLYRLDADADVLPTINLLATSLELTQGVQRADGSIPLIAGKRTFVRLLVHSASGSVNGIKARLYGEGGGINPRTLAPINLGAGGVTISSAPNPLALQQSFLFELPDDWTRANGLNLTAVVNPFNIPRESSTLDNSLSSGAITFRPSGNLSPVLVRYRYAFAGTTYSTTFNQVNRINELARALFPLDGMPSNQVLGMDRPGFHPDVIEWTDDGIGPRLNAQNEPQNNTFAACRYLLTLNLLTVPFTVVDNRNLCAAEYIRAELARLKFLNVIPLTRFAYGMIPPMGNTRVRGQASPRTGVAAGSADNAFTAVHEIAHVLGRDHPFRGSADESRVCNNSLADGAYDFDYPHANSQIGATATSVVGLDYLGYYATPPTIGAFTLLPGNMTSDIIGYCPQQWVSDYTYTCMLRRLSNTAIGSDCDGVRNLPVAQNQAHSAGVMATQPNVGDWLNVIGTLSPDGTKGIWLYRSDAAGSVLAEHAFDVEIGHHSGGHLFMLVVPFVAGTSEVRVVAAGALAQSAQSGDVALIDSQAISANPPTVRDVMLEEPSNPVGTSARLLWNGSDADGDVLSYDILFSADGGQSFVPILSHVTGDKVDLDLSQLGTTEQGLQAIFRVIVNDGAQTDMADSPAYTFASRAPQPMILTPADGHRSQYGQLITFRGMAVDAQQGALSGDSLVWSLDGEHVAFGESASLDTIASGTHTLTLSAMNRYDKRAETSIHLYVGDDLAAHPATLSIAPSSLHVAAAITGSAQSYTISLDNLGNGTLTWRANPSVSWVTLSEESGSTPTTLNVTLSPTGLAAGLTQTTTITFNATDITDTNSTTQTIIFPVSLSLPADVPNQVTTPTPTMTPEETPTPEATPESLNGNTKSLYLPLAAR